MKSKPARSPSDKLKKMFWVCGGLAVAALVVAQITFNVGVYKGWILPHDNLAIANITVQSVESLSRLANVDPVNGKVYFTNARLMLPPSPQGMTIRYTSQEESDGNFIEFNVTTREILDSSSQKVLNAGGVITTHSTPPTAVFDELPVLQACNRGVHIAFSPAQAEEVKPVGSKN